MVAICKFDDMYAAALFENKMKACAGKKLKKKYNRHMSYILTQWREEYKVKKHDVDDVRILDEDSDNSEANYDSDDPVEAPLVYQGKEFYRNPREDSVGLQFLRCWVKSIRMMYISVIYYFMPFFFTFYTFYTALSKTLKQISENWFL